MRHTLGKPVGFAGTGGAFDERSADLFDGAALFCVKFVEVVDCRPLRLSPEYAARDASRARSSPRTPFARRPEASNLRQNMNANGTSRYRLLLSSAAPPRAGAPTRVKPTGRNASKRPATGLVCWTAQAPTGPAKP
jgi:hypothetical protein